MEHTEPYITEVNAHLIGLISIFEKDHLVGKLFSVKGYEARIDSVNVEPCGCMWINSDVFLPKEIYEHDLKYPSGVIDLMHCGRANTDNHGIEATSYAVIYEVNLLNE